MGIVKDQPHSSRSNPSIFLETAIRSYLVRGKTDNSLAFEVPSTIFLNIENPYIVTGVSRLALQVANTGSNVIRLGLHKPRAIMDYYDSIVPLLGVDNTVKLTSDVEQMIIEKYSDNAVQSATIFTGNENFSGFTGNKDFTVITCLDMGPFSLLIPRVGLLVQCGGLVGFVLPEPSLVYSII